MIDIAGMRPVDGDEQRATGNLTAFLDEVRRRGAGLAGEPVRDPAADRDGRFGWDLPMPDGTVVRLLMPGVDLAEVRDDMTATAPCLYLNGDAWWWYSAVGQVTGPRNLVTVGHGGG